MVELPDFDNLGKIPPQAVDLEEVILGALLLEPKALLLVIENLSPDTFYKEQHKLVYRAMLSLHEADKPIDILTVTHALRKTGELELVGGPLFISKLTDRIASTANIEEHSMILKQMYGKREIIRVNNEVTQLAYEDGSDLFEIADYQQKQLALITDTGNTGEKRLSQLLPQININQDNKAKGIRNSVTTGFNAIDKIIRGWHKSNYIILAAMSSMGKTAFVCTSVVKSARKGVRQAVFSLEMKNFEIMYRIVSQETGISYEAIANGEMTPQESFLYNQKHEEIAALPIFIDDTAGISIFDLLVRCKKMVEKYGVEEIWIDYVQLVTLGSMSKKMIGNREQEVSFISKMIKRIAKQCDVPVIALSQLNNDSNKRSSANKRPILSDLRESSALQHDADIVAFIHRPERAGELQDEGGNSTKGKAEFIIAKHRNGKLDIAILKYTDYLMRFDDYISDEQYRMENFETPHPDTFIESKTDKPF